MLRRHIFNFVRHCWPYYVCSGHCAYIAISVQGLERCASLPSPTIPRIALLHPWSIRICWHMHAYACIYMHNIHVYACIRMRMHAYAYMDPPVSNWIQLDPAGSSWIQSEGNSRKVTTLAIPFCVTNCFGACCIGSFCRAFVLLSRFSKVSLCGSACVVYLTF